MSRLNPAEYRYDRTNHIDEGRTAAVALIAKHAKLSGGGRW